LIEYYSFLQESLPPLEFARATLLIGKIMLTKSFANLTDDEYHLLAKIIKVNTT
jgi:hypothetical protein